MVSMIAFLTNFLLASVAFAVPSSVLDTHFAPRRINGRSSVVKYVPDWAGISWEEIPGAFGMVTGTFALPHILGSNGEGVSIWLSIDGPNCNAATLQVGVLGYISDGGRMSFQAWYEWQPATIEFLDFDIETDDVIEVTAYAFSETSGRVVIINKTSGQSIQKDITSSSPLCRQDAMWMVQPFRIPGSAEIIPLADFNQISIVNAIAYDPDGHESLPANITIFDMQWGDTLIMSTSLSEGGAITVQYF